MGTKKSITRTGPGDTPLRELLDETQDNSERQALHSAWDALESVAGMHVAAPEPSGELRAVFREADDRLSDEELDMLAAAGSPMTGAYSAKAPSMPPVSGTAGSPGSRSCAPSVADPLVPSQGQDYLNNGPADQSGGHDDDQTDPACASKDPSARNVLVYGPDDGQDILDDFDPVQDRLSFTGAMSARDIEVSLDGQDTVIRYGRTTIRLQGLLLDREAVWSGRYLP